MGAYICAAIDAAEDLSLVAKIDAGDPRDAALTAEVVVDVTAPDAVMANIAWCIEHGKHMVIGTSGFTAERIAEVESMSAANPSVSILICPNFSIGAILMMQWAQQAARFFPDAEVIEYHHSGKVDAPSGTAVRTAQMIADGRESTPAFSRGGDAHGVSVDGVNVHSVRGDGFLAHQDVMFGGPGERLTIRHDSLDRASFMPGVLTAIRSVTAHAGVAVGLERVLE
ncbi:MAG: hypothetical protein RL745_196, partial [Actinomycetota bacterium]